jgi:hypothetical protein
MKLRLVGYCASLALASIVAYSVATGQFKRLFSPALEATPEIGYPTTLDLGNHEIGDLAIARFAIANRGESDLVIDEVRTNCSCTGLEREENGQFFRIDSLRIKPGEQAALVMRISVRGVPIGSAMRNIVEFRTNDPAKPSCRIEATVRCVSGGICTVPESFVFGTVLMGEPVRKIVEVRDTALPPRTIANVTSTDPDRVKPKLLPLENPAPQEGQANPDGKVIARFEVVVETDSPADVDATVHIHFPGEARKPDHVAVRGRVAAPIELSPSSIVLPRKAASGPLWHADCLCWSNNGQSLTLAVESLIPGLTVQFVNEGKGDCKTVRITWDSQQSKGIVQGTKFIVRIHAKAGTCERVLELIVRVQE